MSDHPFDAYSAYYDLLYADKDYAAEAAFVRDAIERWAPGSRRILEMGCGTGRHARELIALGYEVVGFDSSDTMLERAARVVGLECGLGDARTYRDGDTYDAVIALFHVMSYLTGDDDLVAGMETASVHLPSGGVFAFDAWYGPAVIAQRPERRHRVIEGTERRVERWATPEHDEDAARVDVHYDIAVTLRATGATERFTELHPMRYLFVDEVERLLDDAGFDLVESCEFGSGAPLSDETWGAWFVGVKR